MTVTKDRQILNLLKASPNEDIAFVKSWRRIAVVTQKVAVIHKTSLERH